jgi:hypothetical protein
MHIAQGTNYGQLLDDARRSKEEIQIGLKTYRSYTFFKVRIMLLQPLLSIVRLITRAYTKCFVLNNGRVSQIGSCPRFVALSHLVWHALTHV